MFLRFVIFIGLYSVFTFFAQSQNEKPQVLKVVDSFFNGFHSGDTLIMHKVLADNAKIYTTTSGSNGENVLNQTPLSAFLNNIANRPPAEVWEERLTDTLWHRDGNLAMVWTPYTFWRNGQFSHCGANLFTIVKFDSGWKIITITYSRRKEDCEKTKE